MCEAALQAAIKGGNFGAKLTLLCGFWLDVSFFSHVKKHRSRFWLDVSLFFTCENHRSLLWLARTNLRTKIYDIAFWWVFLSNSPYPWLRQTSKFHQQASFVNKIFCICTFCAWVFFSTLLPWEFISVKLRLFFNFKTRLGGEICLCDVNMHKGYSRKKSIMQFWKSSPLRIIISIEQLFFKERAVYNNVFLFK